MSIPTIILCGGKGTRMKEETEFKPKPLVQIGGKPILWHIMKIYAHHGYKNFILALGYKGELIKEYFSTLCYRLRDFTLDIQKNEMVFHGGMEDDFRITFVDTGLESLTGERILRVKKYVNGDEFMITYGDGVADIDIEKLVSFHRAQKTIATVSGVHPFSKFGLFRTDNRTNLITGFAQKPQLHDYVNGGFLVCNKKFFDYLDNDSMETAFPKLISDRQLSLYLHNGFWRGIDTYHELEELNQLWSSSKPWATWEL